MPQLTRPKAEIERILRNEFPAYATLLPSPISRLPDHLRSTESEAERTQDALRREIERRRRELLTLKLTDPNGFAELLTRIAEVQAQAVEALRFFNQPRAGADFAHWAKLDYWTIEEAIALCFGRSPRRVNRNLLEPLRGESRFAKQFMDALEIATRACAMNQIQESNIPSFFIAWAKRLELPFPTELEALVAKRGPILDWQAVSQKWQATSKEWQEAHGRVMARIAELEQQVVTARAAPPHWPWGSYETTRLGRLAAAVEKFWTNYDSAESDTAPTNEQVAEWLKQQGESPRIAEAIATILRADNLKPGRRGK